MLGQLTTGQRTFLERLEALKKQVKAETWLTSKRDTKQAFDKLRDDATYLMPGDRGIKIAGMLRTARESWHEWDKSGRSWGTIEGRLLKRLVDIEHIVRVPFVKIEVERVKVIEATVTEEQLQEATERGRAEERARIEAENEAREAREETDRIAREKEAGWELAIEEAKRRQAEAEAKIKALAEKKPIPWAIIAPVGAAVVIGGGLLLAKKK